MGNSFTIYSGDNHFVINSEVELCAFALVGLDSQITFGSGSSSWQQVGSEGTSDGKYNYVFVFKPDGSTTTSQVMTDSWVFTLNSGTIPVDTAVHWTNDTTLNLSGVENSSTPFSGDAYYSVEYSTTDAGSGGGDPHIIPFYNPRNKTFVLETNNHTYKYFDNLCLDPNERFVINTKMWVLDNRFIFLTEKLREMNSEYTNKAISEITDYVVDHDYTELDTSFAK